MKTILLVEPNDKIAGLIKQALEDNSSLRIYHANSAQDAIHVADEHAPDLVILELAIPRHNGYAFLHEFRSHSDWADVPVIIHSHLAREEAAMAADWDNLGAVDYLYKPNTSLKQLNRAVAKAMDL